MKMKEIDYNIKVTERLKEPGLFEPFEIVNLVPDKSNDNTIADLVLELRYAGKSVKFLAEVKNRSVPQVVNTGITKILNLVNTAGEKYYPVLVLPFLSKSVVEQLKESQVSGLDLNGNYFISTEEIVGIRLDRKNEYKESTPIRNVFTGNSSIVGRFLLKKNKAYNSLNEIYNEIRRLGGELSLSTVSKVLSRLTEDLIIRKDVSGIYVIQPEKLLLNLALNYKSPNPLKILRLRLPANRKEAEELLDKYFNKWIWSGETSSDTYATTTAPQEFTAYTKGFYNSEEILKLADIRFYNCTLLILPKEQNYLLFDSDRKFASKVQTYIELMQLGKREKEVAFDLEKEILNEFGK